MSSRLVSDGYRESRGAKRIIRTKSKPPGAECISAPGVIKIGFNLSGLIWSKPLQYYFVIFRCRDSRPRRGCCKRCCRPC